MMSSPEYEPMQAPLNDAPAAMNETTNERRLRGERLVQELGGGQQHPTLDHLRVEFPFLTLALTSYALGDVFGRDVLDVRTRQLAIVAAFAALGLTDFVKLHGGYALNAGVSEEELKEIVYLTTIPAGFPRAIQAALALAELFQQRRQDA